MEKLKMYCTYFNNADMSADVYKDMHVIDTTKLHSTDFHKILNENLAFKHIYDNYLFDSEYIGVCSYRRIIPIDSIDIESLTVDTCLTYEALFGRQDNNSFGLFWWSKEHWYNCRFIYNDWLEYCYDYNLTWALETDLLTAKKKIFYNRNCFVMHRDKFKGLVDYNWNFVKYLNDKYDLQWNTENYIKWIQENYVDTHLCDYARRHMKLYDSYIRLIAYLLEIMNHHFIMYNFKEENIKIMNKIYMTRESLKKKIDEIIIKELDLNKNFFNEKTNIMMSDIIKEPLIAYQVLAQIESKLDLLIDDTPMHTKELSYEDFVDIFYNEYLREKGE